MTHALAAARKRRKFEGWRREQNRSSVIAPEVLVTGSENALAWIAIGRGSEIQRNCRIHISEDESLEPRLKIGDRVFVGQGTHLSVMQPMSIGDNTLVGANCYLLTMQHRFESREKPIRDQGYESAPLTIADDVWIGANAVIMPGISIGRGAIVGAGSVLTKSVGAYEIWGGVPAKKLSDRP